MAIIFRILAIIFKILAKILFNAYAIRLPWQFRFAPFLRGTVTGRTHREVLIVCGRETLL